MLKSQLASQVSELTEGNITLQDLTLVSSEIGTTSATLTLSGSVVGDFNKGGMALSTKMVPPDMGVPALTITPGELYITPKSADLSVTFDREELAFKIDSESVVEGDLDRQINVMKNLSSEGFLQSPQITPEMTLIINNFLLPTEISIVNLNAVFEYTFDGEKLDLNFLIDGLGFKPPTTGAFLTILNDALTGVSLPGFTLTLEGASDEKEFVEIEVPSATSEPVLRDPRKVVWTVDNLANLNLVSFEVREWPTPTLTLSQTEVSKGDTVKIEGVLTIEGEPVIGQEVNIVANDVVIGTVETDNEGGFSFTYKFENAGSYEVKSSLEYYEKAVESQITAVTVKPPPLLPPGLVAPVIVGVVIAAAAVGYILMKRR
jgi:polyisoprenoid-binding protein YceI